MREIRLYIYTDAKVRAYDRAKVTYLLQFVKDGRDVGAKDDRMAVDGNQKAATLEAMIAALTRVNDGNEIPITVICHCPGVIQAINQTLYTKWAENSWKNAKGAEIECADKWERIVELIRHKTKDITARPPAGDDEAIMTKLGAEGYNPHTNIA